jgi:hypothetical protein
MLLFAKENFSFIILADFNLKETWHSDMVLDPFT